MMLADAGASVIRVDRAGAPSQDMLARRKTSIAVNLKDPRGIQLIKNLIAKGGVDVIIDPFRPGVLEKLGLGPEVLLPLNQRLIYGRITGYRRDGRYADMAGHDINYIAVSGALGMIGRKGEKPYAPLNLLADFAGGGANLFQGILLALLARQTSGKGQVVEANMVDGANYLTTFPRVGTRSPLWSKPRGENMLDGGCPWYDTYETKDGKYMSVGALEPQFFAQLLRGLGMEGQGWEDSRSEEERWPELRGLFESKFREKSRTEWEAIFDGTDACVAPVLMYEELEEDASGKREGDQRPSVTLRETPCLALSEKRGESESVRGQGEGVEGGGYFPSLVGPGEGGEGALGQWLGWKKGKEFEEENGGVVWTGDKSKL